MIAAARAYATVDKSAPVEAASPHQLVQILFDEALADIARGQRAIERGDFAAKSRHLSRATTLVHALDASLDHGRGGDIAASLATVYAYTRTRITRATIKNDAGEARAAASALAEIASAWRQIA